MTRRIFCKVLLVVVAIFGLLVLSGALLAQGRSEDAFERAIEAQERHTDVLMARPGVVGTAVGFNDDGEYAVLVLLEIPGVAGIPQEFDGVPIQVVVTGEIIALSHATGWFERPVPTGVSTGHPDITAGTIACRVKDSAGDVYALSNNHVYANQNEASIGDAVIQPGTFDHGSLPDDFIGTLADFEPIVFGRKAKNEIGAAIALSSTSLLGTATPSDGGYGTPNSTIVREVVGQQVQKFGRTTELTTGEVTGVNATVNVSYGLGKTAKFVKQIIIEPGGFSAGGDSGSLIVTQSGNNPVGLLFAGSSTITVANRIDLVLERFGVTVDDEAAPPSPVATGSIAGKVTEFDDVAISGASVVVGGTSLSATTDNNGDYSIGNVPEGTYDVTASAAGFESQTKPATVIEDQTTTVNFALTASTTAVYHVFSMDLAVNKRGPWYNLTATMTIHDADDALAPDGVTVTGTISRDGRTFNYSKETRGGQVNFKLKTQLTETKYTVQVADVDDGAESTFDSTIGKPCKTIIIHNDAKFTEGACS